MPNHITTKIAAPAEVIEAITRGHTPEEIQTYKDETEGIRNRELTEWFTAERKERALKSRGERAEEMLTEKITDFGLVIPQPANIETGDCPGRHEPGIICWLDWSIGNWGTKWNAYDTKTGALEDGTGTLQFDTAWSHPFPVLEALSVKFPNHPLDVEYADEDLGYNLGKYTITNGERSEQADFEEGTGEALEFAAQLKYGKTYAELQKEWGED
ncbi:hypothetical protein [Glutamicibacter protophormiae]|uniref:DUF1281 family ferredoxin-like fold protein n=1 Tax=Glutamicibacter protophormiae TaxID=37930 RepID=UPI003A91884A